MGRRLPNPRGRELGDDWNYWINFVLYAVVGRMGQADSLFRQHATAIRRVAEWMRTHQPFVLQTPIYRGLLLAPSDIRDGELAEAVKEGTQFVSWTEDHGVACWFAHPRSVISGGVLLQRPEVAGYLQVDQDPDPNRVLWHHSWSAIPLGDLVAFGAMHPEIDHSQLAWNMNTQSEVILDVGGSGVTAVTPLSQSGCAEVDELDARLTFPPFLEEFLWGGAF